MQLYGLVVLVIPLYQLLSNYKKMTTMLKLAYISMLPCGLAVLFDNIELFRIYGIIMSLMVIVYTISIFIPDKKKKTEE